MKKRFIPAVLCSMMLFGCTSNEPVSSTGYRSVTAEEAQDIMNETADYIILDVRTQDEYDTGHIPGAVCIPYDAISEENTADIDKDQTVLVYCRSGNRSRKACATLVSLGFTNVIDFGGISDWPGTIVKN